ncbi:GNAT family N-acetyltransferase [Actinotalea sp. M2MS4P-6]|uniref:GNAT family N-acetyltransferase n=1 Tax=Actinotalea sp. M2MS4P-6 TaxID=2983762 RepID=UPI0021E51630|nr:GNAT family N-acetyltransferase [Actinotalea sp. M2MS4P-6]MCV2393083.1 GNAT family N-acetyltransferase [Actinotalea sp. M2MS4P-6]
MSLEVAAMTAAHWPQVREIYAAGIATGNATFESEPPTWVAFDSSRLPGHRWVVLDEGRVLGWAAATPVSARPVYAGVVEHSVYVHADARGCGVGRIALGALLDSTECAGIWTVQSGVFPENTASLALHAALGFRVVGTRERIGRMGFGPLAGQWRDVVMIERRAAVDPD